MNARARIFKEARQLLWPWLLVIAAGLFTLLFDTFRSHFRMATSALESMEFLFVMVGLPLLATLPTGLEFEQRTMELLLAQPVPRNVIWREKQLVTLAALVPAAIISYFSVLSFRHLRGGEGIVSMMLVAAMCLSAQFWTLIAKTNIGGLALNAAAGGTLFFCGWVYPQNYRPEFANYSSNLVVAASVLMLGYGVVLQWYGRRSFLRLEAYAGNAGDEILARFLGRVTPAALQQQMGSRPSTPLANLVRRELRLLQPIWAMVALNGIAWTYMLVFNLLPTTHGSKEIPVVYIFTMTLNPLIAFISGSLSLGEEKTLGTHDWHMTIPISVGGQWLVKLAVAEFTALFGAAILPIGMAMIGGALRGSPFLYVGLKELWVWPTAVAAICIFSFWSSCLVKGTVKATLWTFPILFSIAIAGEVGMESAHLMVVASTRVMQQLWMIFDPFAVSNSLREFRFDRLFQGVVAVVLLIALHGSYRQFRGQSGDSLGNAVRKVLPATALVFAAAFAFGTFLEISFGAREQQYKIFHETHAAIEKLDPSIIAGKDAAHPVTLSVEMLGAASPLSEGTRHWLGNNPIALRPHTTSERNRDCCRDHWSIESTGLSGAYVASLRLQNGRSCRMSFNSTQAGVGGLGAVCD